MPQLLLTVLAAQSAHAAPLIQVITESIPQADYTEISTEVNCPVDRVAISGGARVFGSVNNVVLTASTPLGAFELPRSWFIEAQEITPTVSLWGLRVDVWCAEEAAVANHIVWLDSFANDVGAVVTATATCPAGMSALSGGARISGDKSGIGLTTNGPEGDDSWLGIGLDHLGVSAGYSMFTDVICVPDSLMANRIDVQTEIVGPSNGYVSHVMSCPGGSYSLSGGARIAGAITGTGLVISGPEGPAAAPDQWFTFAQEVGVAGNWQLRSDLYCITP